MIERASFSSVWDLVSDALLDKWVNLGAAKQMSGVLLQENLSTLWKYHLAKVFLDTYLDEEVLGRRQVYCQIQVGIVRVVTGIFIELGTVCLEILDFSCRQIRTDMRW